MTDISTQQFSDSYFHTDAIFKEEILHASFTEQVHPRQLKQFLPSAVHNNKRRVSDHSLMYSLPLPNVSGLLQQHELNSTSDAAEKFSVPAKLFSTRLLSLLLITVFSSFFLSKIVRFSLFIVLPILLFFLR
jgi:hypothetical protein